ncbi:integrin alpha-6-like [Salvelinus alpinus]|uniref:integrin alpha-6-like n=1 Tax=Salvelinus alpinus TaxID=8036 RepID=UPI0039FD14CA
MNNTATILVRAGVWNSTVLEDCGEAWRVTVNGKATLKLVTDKPTIRMNTESREFTLDIDPELGDEDLYQVPLWITIVSSVAGVLLLAFIILLMWKVTIRYISYYNDPIEQVTCTDVSSKRRMEIQFHLQQQIHTILLDGPGTARLLLSTGSKGLPFWIQNRSCLTCFSDRLPLVSVASSEGPAPGRCTQGPES